MSRPRKREVGRRRAGQGSPRERNAAARTPDTASAGTATHVSAAHGAWAAAAPWLLTIVALGIRLYHLGREPLWFDEAYTALAAVKPIHDIIALLQGEGNAPLYYVVLHLWSRSFGDSEYMLRLPSALIGAATIPLIYWVGRRMFSAPAGAIAAALAAVSPLHVHYSQEVRMYAMVPPLAVGLLYGVFRLLTRPNIGAVVVSVLAATAGLYVHYYFLFLLPLAALAVVSPAGRRSLIFTTAALMLVAVGFAPWLPTFLHQAAGGVQDWVAQWWRTRPFWYAVPWSIESLGPGAQYPPMASFKFGSSLLGRVASLSLATLVLGGAVVLLYKGWRGGGERETGNRKPETGNRPMRRQVSESFRLPVFHLRFPVLHSLLRRQSYVDTPAERRDDHIALLLTLAAVLVPLLLAFVISLIRNPIYVVARHDLIAWGAYYLLAGAVFSRIAPRFGVPLIGLWLGLSLFTLGPYFTTARPKRNYADLGDRIAQALTVRAKAGETVVFTASTRTMTEYYLRTAPGRLRLASYPLGTDAHLGWIDPRIRTDHAFAVQAARGFAAWLGGAGPLPAVIWIVAPASRGTAPLLAELERRGYRTDRRRSGGVLLCLRRG